MIKFGIIGMGIRGKLYANTIKQNPYAEVAAVCDVSPENLKYAQEQYDASGYHEFEQLLDDKKLDAVIIATPDFLHKNAVIAAAQKVKNIMIEKPLSTSLEECDEMCAAIRSNKVRCLMAFDNRWSATFLAVKARIDSGSCGEILNISAKLNNTLYVPTKMLSWSSGSTPAWFLFPHMIDMACWLSGKTVKKVYASGFKKKLVSMGIDTYDSISALMNFTDGTTAMFSSTWVLPESMPVMVDYKFDIYTENEAIFVDLLPQTIAVAASQNYTLPRTLGIPINGQLNGPSTHMLNSFIDNIRLDTEPDANEETGRLNARIVDAVHKSLKLGTAIEV